jgi:uncharacterized ferritin-like protein (DUF455 family)
MQLRPRALEVLRIPQPEQKAAAARALLAALHEGVVRIDPAEELKADDGALPGRPALPRLVAADQVPRRSPFTLAGRAALLHAIAHIEFNAIKNCLYNSQVAAPKPANDLRLLVHPVLVRQATRGRQPTSAVGGD